MEPIPESTLKKVNEAAIYNLYLCLPPITAPAEGTSLRRIVSDLQAAVTAQTPPGWEHRDSTRLHLLKNAVAQHAVLADSTLGDLTRSKSGLTACSFTQPGGEVFVVFKGTGSGEWIDNGEGFSGIPEENTYVTYGENGRVISRRTVLRDHASDQQVEALNWFLYIAAKNRWNRHTPITLSGHSKGGNKAQFAAICSDLATACYSFDGQGFSPEALDALRSRYGAAFEARRQRIRSFSAKNDYVNVLGMRLMPATHIHFFEASGGLHYLEAMLEDTGRFRPQSEQGKLSRRVEAASETLMQLRPSVRRYATRGVMNIFQQYLGEGTPVNNDAVSIEETAVGIGIALGSLLRSPERLRPPQP